MRNLLLIGLAASLPSCVTDEGTEDVSATQQLVSGWAAGTWGTTTDLAGADTGWSGDTSTCVMSALRGNLSDGGYWQDLDEPSVGFVRVDPSNGHYFMRAHGGAFETNGQRVWTNNPVLVGTVCVPYVSTGSPIWSSKQSTVAPPLKLAGLATNRRCFLQGVQGGQQLFTNYADYVRVRKVTSVDATHPTTGWYLESNLVSTANNQPALAIATCVDFPTISAEWGGAFGGATYSMTTGTGVKMCGLTGVYGAYTANSWTDGVALNPPSTQNGNWTMTVSANKYAEANCIQ